FSGIRHLLASTVKREESRECTILIRDIFRKKPVARLSSADFFTNAASFSPDGRLVATLGDRSTSLLVVWEIATGRQIHSFSERNDVKLHNCIAFSNNNRFLAVCSGGRVATIWDLWALGLRPEKNASKERIDQLWSDLATEDPKVAFLALWSLVALPRHSLAL